MIENIKDITSSESDYNPMEDFKKFKKSICIDKKNNKTTFCYGEINWRTKDAIKFNKKIVVLKDTNVSPCEHQKFFGLGGITGDIQIFKYFELSFYSYPDSFCMLICLYTREYDKDIFEKEIEKIEEIINNPLILNEY